jgi:hypothetical protein
MSEALGISKRSDVASSRVLSMLRCHLLMMLLGGHALVFVTPAG